MKCTRCNTKIRAPKKYQIIKCKCGAEFMMIEIGGNKSLEPMYRKGKEDE